MNEHSIQFSDFAAADRLKNILSKCAINVYNHIMNERAKAIKALEKADYFFKRHGAIMIYIATPN